MNAIENHMLEAMRHPTISKLDPFPYFYTENVFPQPFYDHLMGVLDTRDDYTSETSTGHYGSRTFAHSLGVPELDFMEGFDFLHKIIGLFQPQFLQRFPEGRAKLTRDLRLVRDSKDYKIGPHTDAKWKVVSLLFYLPRDDSLKQYGTSVYVPIDPTARCEGGPHYGFNHFHEIWRAPFLPNTCLGFWKTDKSFHGVNPIPEEIRRDVLLYNIYTENR